MDNNPILNKIDTLMRGRNWSLYKLAQESNIPYSSLNSMFIKNTQPTIPTLEKICAGLNISLADFFSDKHQDDIPYLEISEDVRELLDLYNSMSKADKDKFIFYARGFAKTSPSGIKKDKIK